MPKYSEIYTAIGEGNIEKIKSLLASSDLTPLNNSNQMALLHYAVKNGHVKVIELLVAKGFDVNAQDEDEEGITPLHIAAENGDPQCVKKLLELGAKPNISTLKSTTPLHLAATTGNVECIQALLNAGADPNSKNIISKTPAHCIAQSGNLDAIKKLAEWGMDIHAKDTHNRHPINYARNYGHLQAVEEFIKMGAKNYITLDQLFAAFGGEKLYSVLPPNLQSLHHQLLNDTNESIGIFIYYLTSFFKERECIEDDVKEKQILNIYKDIYKNHFKKPEELSNDLEKNGMIIHGLRFSGHAGTASIKKENDMITFSTYDRGELIQFNFTQDEKGKCVRAITGKLDTQQTQQLISLVKKINVGSKTTKDVNDTIYKDDVPNLFGNSIPFEYKNYLLQKPDFVGFCFHHSYKVPIADLFITFFGLQKGLSIYKDFTLFYLKKISIDFQQSNTDIEVELKTKLKNRCDEILDRKIDIANYKQSVFFNTKNVNCYLKKLKYLISDLCDELPKLEKQIENAQNYEIYNQVNTFYRKIKALLEDQNKLMDCFNNNKHSNILTKEEIIKQLTTNIELLSNFFINVKRYRIHCALKLDNGNGKEEYIGANKKLFEKKTHILFSNLDLLSKHVQNLLERFSNNNLTHERGQVFI